MSAHEHIRHACELAGEALAEAEIQGLSAVADRLLELNAALWKARWELGILAREDGEDEEPEASDDEQRDESHVIIDHHACEQCGRGEV
jgi:hypothetical protein